MIQITELNPKRRGIVLKRNSILEPAWISTNRRKLMVHAGRNCIAMANAVPNKINVIPKYLTKNASGDSIRFRDIKSNLNLYPLGCLIVFGDASRFRYLMICVSSDIDLDW